MSSTKMLRVARIDAFPYADIAPVSQSRQPHAASVGTCFFLRTNRGIPYPLERHQLFHPEASECSGNPPHALSHNEFRFRCSSPASSELSEPIRRLLCIRYKYFAPFTMHPNALIHVHHIIQKAPQVSKSPGTISTYPCVRDDVSFPLALVVS